MKIDIPFELGDPVRVSPSPEGENYPSPHYGWGLVDANSVGIVREVKVHRSYGQAVTLIIVDFPEQQGWSAKSGDLVKTDFPVDGDRNNEL